MSRIHGLKVFYNFANKIYLGRGTCNIILEQISVLRQNKISDDIQLKNKKGQMI